MQAKNSTLVVKPRVGGCPDFKLSYTIIPSQQSFPFIIDPGPANAISEPDLFLRLSGRDTPMRHNGFNSRPKIFVCETMAVIFFGDIFFERRIAGTVPVFRRLFRRQAINCFVPVYEGIEQRKE